MLSGFLLKGAALAAVVAGVAAFSFYQDGKAKAREIETLQGQLTMANSTTQALTELASRRGRAEANYDDVIAAINAAGERTSDACLSDPRVRAYYDGFQLRHDARSAAP